MKITSKKEATILFKDIRPGEVFKYGPNYGIKIHPLTDEDESQVDAINLMDGTPLYISVYERVSQIETELIVS